MHSLCFGALCTPKLQVCRGMPPAEHFGKVQLLRCNSLQSGACSQEKIRVKFSEKYSLKVHLFVEDSTHFDQEKENMILGKVYFF